MKLYSYPPAPSPQRVHFFMKEKGIDLPVEVIDMMAAEQLGDAYKAINPRGTVPALVLDDGTVISDVVAIYRYLEMIFPDTPLLGADAKEQALISEWDHRIEMEFLTAIAEALRNHGRSFKGRAFPGDLDIEQIPELVARGRLRAEAFFNILDQQLASNVYVAGEKFSAADITAFVGIRFCAWIKLAVPEEMVNLQRWLLAVSQRPSMAT
ncbi:Glutathione S-transferase GST-6.0 [Sinobacterium norvegicum]|uniref:Glutathione S-transferase GST-6.0 n=1 Tax=Sinobacterium norvegicum TaxID=1641715 RepID=A0ABN8ENP7_9GAMM|nr:glutathione S-transferase family protein [Sinobacterium norvegicum]CAH0991781.1 Glutathione S-transferase GST-6.0 [Sinobacterium norvegicum]